MTFSVTTKRYALSVITGLVFLAFAPSVLHAQVVGQGPGGTSAWRVNFGGSAQPVTISSGTVTTITNPVAVTKSGTWDITFASPQAVTQSGTWTVTAAGGKTNNNAAPGATNIGAIPCVANASDPSYTEGNLTFLSCDLAGNMRIRVGNSSATVTEDGDIPNDAASTAEVASVTYGYDGTSRKVIRAKASAPGSGEMGLVVRPLMPTNGTQDMPSMDAAARRGFQQITDGTNSMPTGDTVGRAIFHKVTDGTTTWAEPCSFGTKQFLPVNISTNTTTEITPSLSGASNYYYVCAINLVTAAANNVALVDDNTDGCGSVTAGLAGGTTAASGWNLAANTGLTLGNGAASVMRSVTQNAVLCLVTSAATQLSGHLVVVPAP